MLEPAALLALLSLPAIVALHLFRRSRERRVVSALFLWEEEAPIARAGRRREPLQRSPSLLFELLAAACLAFALAGPRGCDAEEPRHLVYVLDDTASMSARDDDNRSAAERVRAEIDGQLAAAPASTRVTLLASGEPPHVLSGPLASRDEARAALALFAPHTVHHSLAPAVALARAGWRDGEIRVFSDRAHELEETLELRAVGVPRSNWAFLAARRFASSEPKAGERIELEVASFAAEDAELLVSVEELASGAARARRAITLRSGERATVELELAEPAGDLRASLRAPASDALAFDDLVHLPAAPPRALRLRLEAPVEDRRALRLERANGALCDPRGLGASAWVAAGEPCELHLGRGPAPLDAPAALLWSAPREGLRELASPFLLERAHPLLRGVELEGLVWVADPLARPPGRALVRAGEIVLLSEEWRGARWFLHLNLVPERSTLGSSPDWPVLLANAIELREATQPGPRERIVPLGRSPRAIGIPHERYELRELEGPLRFEARASADGALALPPLPRVGRYQLAALAEEPDRTPLSSDADRGPWTIAAALFDERESDLRGAMSLQRGDAPKTATVRSASTSTGSALLAALFVAFLLLDWLWLARAARRGAAR